MAEPADSPPAAPPASRPGASMRPRPVRIRSLALRTYERAREVARVSMLPPARPGHEGRVGWVVVLLVQMARRLARRAAYDRIADRAAALAFYTVLSLLPIIAVTFAVLRNFGGVEAQQRAIKEIVAHYFPSITEEAVTRLMPRITGIDVQAAGLVGLAALLPVMMALVSQVERALADVFRKPRRGAVFRWVMYALLVTVAPMVTVMSVEFAPKFEVPTFDRHIGPFLVTSLVLFLAFRFLPGARVRNRGALIGAVVSAFLLALLREVFGVYATVAGQTLSVVWGTITFVPLVLVWVFLSWLMVLLGAEIAAVVHELTEQLRAPDIVDRPRHPHWRPRWKRWGRRRIRRTIAPPSSS